MRPQEYQSMAMLENLYTKVVDSLLTGYTRLLPFILKEVNAVTPLGQRIRTLRQEAGLTVQDFAGKIEKTAGYVSRIEARDEIPSVELLIAIASIFKIKPDELFVLAKTAQLDRVAEQIEAKQQVALELFRKRKP